MEKMIIITAPSGAGKTTIVKHLLEVIPNMAFSISATTRDPRPHETNGKEYYFISHDEFLKKVQEGQFIEYEEVYENQYYGTLKSEVDRIWAEGKSVIFDIDVKGALNLKKIYGDAALSIFIKPPSFKVLEDRLKNRKTENKTSLAKRIKRAKFELSFESEFDQVLINDILENSFSEGEKIVNSFLN